MLQKSPEGLTEKPLSLSLCSSFVSAFACFAFFSRREPTSVSFLSNDEHDATHELTRDTRHTTHERERETESRESMDTTHDSRVTCDVRASRDREWTQDGTHGRDERVSSVCPRRALPLVSNVGGVERRRESLQLHRTLPRAPPVSGPVCGEPSCTLTAALTCEE
jgi:hypothetical protein